MSSVTKRIKQVKQPRGGFINPSDFKAIKLTNKEELNENENVDGFIIGMAVDYLTRFLISGDIQKAFSVSLKGALAAGFYGVENAFLIANELAEGITALDEQSIINACKLVTFDVWYRKPSQGNVEKGYAEISPDYLTIQNIKILVERSLLFFEQYGQITADGFTFFPEGKSDIDCRKELRVNGVCGGYTSVVSRGDGDFLTKDTLWDFKVSKSKPTSAHTLQLLMYWIMGKHSGQDIFKSITRLGIFNPRLNTVYLLDIKDIPEDIIKTVEREVICYK